jgi:hypothetical protein
MLYSEKMLAMDDLIPYTVNTNNLSLVKIIDSPTTARPFPGVD